MRISAIVAMSQNRVIGRAGQLPWKLPEDLKHFRRLTTGHPVIMGRKTYESIGRVLPHRDNIIVSRQVGLAIPGAQVVLSLEKAFQLCQGKTDEIFVIGGAQIYEAAYPFIQRLYLTLIQKEMEGDTFFPVFNPSDFTEVSREERTEEGEHPFSYTFLVLDR